MRVNLERLTRGLPPPWRHTLHSWDRSLRAVNHPDTTRYIYLLAVAQLATFLASEPSKAPGAAEPAVVTTADVEEYLAWMIRTRSAATAQNKYRSLRRYFKWLAADRQITGHSPMEQISEPRAPMRLVPIIRAEETRRILRTCRGREFVQMRDAAIIRLFSNTGGRLSEVATLRVEDVNLTECTVLYHGKGSRDRQVAIGRKTVRAIRRYLQARNTHPGAGQSSLWLVRHSARPLSASSIHDMLKRRAARTGVPDVHAGRWRHTFAHEWKLARGDSGDLMHLMGWSTEEMVRRYGASAAAERARQAQRRLRIGERI